MAGALAFTAAEAAFVLREPIKAVKKAFDAGPIEPKLVSKPGGPVRTVEWLDILYLLAMRTLRTVLTPKARDEFYHALKRSPVDGLREVRFGRLCVVVEDFKAEVEARAWALEALGDKVEFRNDGEPVLRDTHVEVHRIAALLDGGMSIEEVRIDYPSLTRQQVEDARAYAEAHPKTGRPYPRTSFKRAIQGAGLQALDEVLDGW